MATWMPSVKTMRANSLILILVLMTGCFGTVKPVKVTPQQASFDGTNQNSGVVSFDKVNHVGEVTPDWRLKYNGLIETYGDRFIPWLVKDYGLISKPNGNWIATAEAFENRGKMELWRRNNIK